MSFSVIVSERNVIIDVHSIFALYCVSARLICWMLCLYIAPPPACPVLGYGAGRVMQPLGGAVNGR